MRVTKIFFEANELPLGLLTQDCIVAYIHIHIDIDMFYKYHAFPRSILYLHPSRLYPTRSHDILAINLRGQRTVTYRYTYPRYAYSHEQWIISFSIWISPDSE